MVAVHHWLMRPERVLSLPSSSWGATYFPPEALMRSFLRSVMRIIGICSSHAAGAADTFTVGVQRLGGLFGLVEVPP